MNAMTEAFVQAGVKLPPVRERLWRHIKDNPGIYRKELRAAFSALPEGTFSGQLWALLNAGQVYERDEFVAGKRRARLYTDMEVYVAFPRTKKERYETPPAQTPGQITPDVKCPSSPDALLDSLTIAQARELYVRLKRMFG